MEIPFLVDAALFTIGLGPTLLFSETASRHTEVTMLPVTGLLLMLQASVGVLAIPAPSPNPDATDFDLTPEHVALMRRQSRVPTSLTPNYNQNYKTSGNVQITPASNGYSVNFKGAQDFVVGRGWTKGDAR